MSHPEIPRTSTRRTDRFRSRAAVARCSPARFPRVGPSGLPPCGGREETGRPRRRMLDQALVPWPIRLRPPPPYPAIAGKAPAACNAPPSVPGARRALSPYIERRSCNWRPARPVRPPRFPFFEPVRELPAQAAQARLPTEVREALRGLPEEPGFPSSRRKSPGGPATL